MGNSSELMGEEFEGDVYRGGYTDATRLTIDGYEGQLFIAYVGKKDSKVDVRLSDGNYETEDFCNAVAARAWVLATLKRKDSTPVRVLKGAPLSEVEMGGTTAQ